MLLLILFLSLFVLGEIRYANAPVLMPKCSIVKSENLFFP